MVLLQASKALSFQDHHLPEKLRGGFHLLPKDQSKIFKIMNLAFVICLKYLSESINLDFFNANFNHHHLYLSLSFLLLAFLCRLAKLAYYYLILKHQKLSVRPTRRNSLSSQLVR